MLALAAASVVARRAAFRSRRVNVTIKAVPEHAAVYAGDDRIGIAPGPIELDTGKKVTLTFQSRRIQVRRRRRDSRGALPFFGDASRKNPAAADLHGATPHDSNSLENPF